MYQARRARDQQLNETRKEVEKRKETVDRTERRVRRHIQIYIFYMVLSHEYFICIFMQFLGRHI